MKGKKFLAACVVAMVTIVHSFGFTPAKRYHKSSHISSPTSYDGSFESKVSSWSALGMATWSNGKLTKVLYHFVLDACLCSNRPCIH